MAFKMIDSNYCPYVAAYREDYICDTDEDFANLPKCCTGSTAVSIKSGAIRMVDTNGDWVAFAEEG